MSGPLRTVSFQLTYGDCDPAGIVYYANYFRWMEHTHTTWWHEIGEPIDTFPERYGIGLVTRHTGCEFTAPAHPFDIIKAELWADSVGNTSFRMRVDFSLESGAQAAVGDLTLVSIGPDGRPAPLPDVLRERLVV